MKSFETVNTQDNPDNPENNQPEQINSKDRDREIIQRYAREKEERDSGKYKEDKEQVSLDPELQSELSQTENQIEELKVRGRTNEAKTLEEQSRKKLEETIKQYKEASNEVLVKLPMKALEAENKTITLDTESDKKTFSDSFYESETVAEVNEEIIDPNLLKKISTGAGRDGKVFELTEHTEKSTADGTEQRADKYILTEYSNDPTESDEDDKKVFIGYAKDHAGKYLKIFSLDTKGIDGKKYTMDELKEAPTTTEVSPESKSPDYQIVNLQMGMEMLTHDLGNKMDADTITDEQITEFNEKLTQDWTEVDNLLKSELNSATKQQEQYKKLKNDLIENFLVPYSASDPEASSPNSKTEEEISDNRNSKEQTQDALLKKIKVFSEHFAEDGEPLKQLADQAIDQKLSPENVRKLADQIDKELQSKVEKLGKQKHFSEEGLLNSKVLSPSTGDKKVSQEQVDDQLYFHSDRAKQIADLESGTWKQPRRRSE